MKWESVGEVVVWQQIEADISFFYKKCVFIELNTLAVSLLQTMVSSDLLQIECINLFTCYITLWVGGGGVHQMCYSALLKGKEGSKTMKNCVTLM